MTNREKLLNVLKEMSDSELAESIDIHCDECPAKKYCDSNIGWDSTCQEIMKLWLEEGEEDL